jgi:hypothetical protein
MSNRDLKLKKFVNMMAFVALVLVATALIVSFLLARLGVGDVALIQLIENVGWLIASFVLIFVALFYVRTKRKPIWFVVYAVSVTIVIILQILNFVL